MRLRGIGVDRYFDATIHLGHKREDIKGEPWFEELNKKNYPYKGPI